LEAARVKSWPLFVYALLQLLGGTLEIKSFIAEQWQECNFLCAADAAGALCLRRYVHIFKMRFLRCSTKFLNYSSALLAEKLALNNFTPESHSPQKVGG
jgi:hypothetical protein